MLQYHVIYNILHIYILCLRYYAICLNIDGDNLQIQFIEHRITHYNSNVDKQIP